MKKVINGRMYDTETATMLADRTHGVWGNYDYAEEELYRKKNGEHFIRIYGKVLSVCLAWFDFQTGYCDGHWFVPIGERVAKKWAEENLDGDKYVEIFGEVEE